MKINSIEEIVAKAEKLRISGAIDTSLAVCIEHFEQYKSEKKYISELIKNLVLNKLFEPALKIIRSAHQFFPEGGFLEPEEEILARLHIVFPDDDLMQFRSRIQPASPSQWIRDLSITGRDNFALLNIHHLEMREEGQAPVFHFELFCSSCSGKFGMNVYKTPMVRKVFFCAHCFAKYFIEYDTIRDIIKKEFTSGSAKDIFVLDEAMYRLREKVFHAAASSDADVPLLAQYLNVNYLYTQTRHLLRIMRTDKDNHR